jgi:Carboxypeptidase regulatory-like domain
MQRPVRQIACVLMAIVCLAVPAQAQVAQTGNIVGRVMDPNGGVLPGVTVELASPSLLRHEMAATDAKGAYRFIQLPVGLYSLTFSLQGFSTTVRQQIPVSADKTLTLDVTMQLATVAETITVSGAAPVVDVKSATSSVHIDRHAIDEIPTSRDVWSFLQNQAPQVVNSREDVGGSESGLQATFSAHGSSLRQNTFMFSGINVTGVNSTGTTDLYFDYDSFEEIQISTAAHKAEVSTPGVYLNIVPRSGSDSWRGTVQEFFTDQAFQSQNLTDALRTAGVTRGQGIDRINGFSAQFGGPVVKERLRIYGNYRDDRTNRFVIGFPLTEDTIIRAPLVNGTYQLDENNRLKGLITYNKYDKPRRNAGALLAPEATWIEDDHTTVWGAEWQRTVHSSTLLDFRVAHVGNVFQLFLQPDASGPYTQEQTTGRVTGAANRGSQNRHERFQLSGAVTYYQPDWLGGSHDIKAGYDISRGPNETRFFALQDINLVTSRGAPFSVLEYNTPALPRELHWFAPVYVQDQYSIKRTTVSLGLRFEGYRGIVRESSVPAGRFVAARSFAEKPGMSFAVWLPRVSISHDLLGNSRIALKGSVGRYAHTPGSPWFNAISEAGLAGTTYRWNDLNGDSKFQPGEEGQVLSTFGGSITSIDPNVRQPYTDEVTAGVDSQVGRDIRVSAEFVYRREHDLLALSNTGVPFGSFSPVSALDPGPDGVAGTADDAPITVFNQDKSTLGRDRLLVTNPSGFGATFRGFELTAQKRLAHRWQWLASFAASHQDISALSVAAVSGTGAEQESSGLSTTGSPFLNPNNLVNNNGGPGFFDRTYIFKTSGSYQLPLDILMSAVFKAQSGTPYARVVTLRNDVNGNALNQGAVSVYAEPRGSRRFPALRTLDLRVAKSFGLGRQRKIEAMIDVFNAGNTATITSINGQTGPQFGAPLAILGPRVMRLGFRYSF